jgi:hypothetical protein
MTSIQVKTSELHDLLTPVLPHTGDGKGMPALSAIRLEVRANVAYAVATDRYTMAITRHTLDQPTPDTTIAIGKTDASAMLKLFKFGRNDNPDLQLTVGKIEAETVLDPADKPALTVTAKDGATLVLHGREDALSTWRTIVAKLVHRAPKTASPSLALSGMYLSRWTKAIRKGGQLEVFLGADATDPVVIRAGDSFIGVWAACSRRDSSGGDLLADSPWGVELPAEKDAPAETVTAPPARPKAVA